MAPLRDEGVGPRGVGLGDRHPAGFEGVVTCVPGEDDKLAISNYT